MEVIAKPHHAIFRLQGGYQEAKDLGEQLARVKNGELPPHVLFDVSGLGLLQSYHIGLMVKTKSVTDSLNGRFLLVGDSEELRDILEMVDIGFRVERYASLEEAEAALG